MSFLVQDSNGVYTSARNNGANGPITDVSVQQSIAYDTANDMMKINSMQKKWKDAFNGASLDNTKWNVISTGSGMTITATGGVLTIATGVTANAETILESTQTFTDPFRVICALQISQKIANQEFAIEVYSVNPTTLADDNINMGAWNFSYEDNSQNTYGVYEVMNNGTKLRSGANYLGGPTQNVYNLYELELFSDEFWFHSRYIDSSNGRSASFVRHQQIPDPNALYKVRIRAKNKATAPASNTNYQLQFMTVIDYAELTAEITAGRGNVAMGQAIAMQMVNNPTVYANLQQNANWYTDTTTNLASNALYTGTTRDSGSTTVNPWTRFRVIVGHQASNTHGHLIIEQSADNVTWRETHRRPIPSDGMYRTYDFPYLQRYIRVKFQNGATAQSLMYVGTMLIHSDGETDLDRTLSFLHSTTALGASASFTGNTMDLGGNHEYRYNNVMAYSDQAGTLYVDQSRDGSTWYAYATIATTGGAVSIQSVPIVQRYSRVRFANGATAQTVFELSNSLTQN